jgi:hypothetical protein
MKNLNEPRRSIQPEAEVTPGEVIPMESRRNVRVAATQPSITSRETQDLRSRWTAVQANFVDEPRKAVEEADGLISSTIQQISEDLRNERAQLQSQWSKGGDASTEDLRMVLQHYRTLFERLMSM